MVVPAVPGMTDVRPPSWLAELLGVELPPEGSEFMLGGRPFRMAAGIPRDSAVPSATQAQTSEVFDFLWQKENYTYLYYKAEYSEICFLSQVPELECHLKLQ